LGLRPTASTVHFFPKTRGGGGRALFGGPRAAGGGGGGGGGGRFASNVGDALTGGVVQYQLLLNNEGGKNLAPWGQIGEKPLRSKLIGAFLGVIREAISPGLSNPVEVCYFFFVSVVRYGLWRAVGRSWAGCPPFPTAPPCDTVARGSFFQSFLIPFSLVFEGATK